MKKFNKIDILRLLGVAIIMMVMTTSAVVWAINISSKNGALITYEQAMKDNKPSLVMFHSKYCSYCVKFMPIFKEMSKEYKDKYNFVTVDSDDRANYPIISEYRIGSLPSLYIIDPKIDNRIYINPTFYSDTSFVKLEIDRYLRIRAMIK